MLHTLNKSPFLFRNLESCLRLAQKGDPILFYEDGVYTVMRGTEIEPFVTKLLKEHPVYVVQADIKARGITELLPGVHIIDYSGFVDLAEQHNVCPWL